MLEQSVPVSAPPEDLSTNLGARRWGTLGIAFGVQVFCALSLAFLSPLAPFLMAPTGLGISGAEFGLLFSAANLGTMIMLIITGHLVDRAGVRVIMLIGQVLMGAAVMVGALTNAPWQLLVILFICGIAQSCAGPTGAKMIFGWFERRLRALAMGIKQAGIPAASFLAGAIIPVVATAIGWRGTVAIVGGLIVLAGILSFVLYKEPPVSEQHAAAKVTFREASHHVFTRDITLLSIGGGIMQAVQFVFTSFLVAYLTKSFTADGVKSAVIVAGTFLSLSAIGGVIGRVGLGVLSDRLFGGRRKGVLVAVNIIATAILALLALVGTALPTPVVAALVFVFGLTGIAFTGLQINIATELAGFRFAGAATGFTLALAFAGMMILPPIAGGIVDRTGGYTWFWWTLAILGVIGVVFLSLVREKKKEVEPVPAPAQAQAH